MLIIFYYRANKNVNNNMENILVIKMIIISL